MDALSEVLQAIRLDGAMYLDAEFTAPWCIAAQFGLHTATEHLPRSDHIAFFHVLTDGTCRARLVDGHEVLDLKAGDILMFPHDHAHLLGSDVSLPPSTEDEIVETHADSGMFRMHSGGGGAATRFVCGFLACDPRICRPLFSALPRMLRVSIGDEAAWLLQMLRVGVQESSAQGPGAQSLLAKLAELMFVEAIRRFALSQPADRRGWLAGLRDRHVGRALALLHGRPAHPWTVDGLAREVALSRSAFAERFVELIGEPPMQYLTRWRLALAAQRLRAGNETVARIAEIIGYESEAAFNRAFKREFGMPPSAWRRSVREDAPGAETDESAAS
jgi:AraC family transcriptional regulator, alkane utilization regulator